MTIQPKHGATPRLHQLPNRMWVDPAAVLSIEPVKLREAYIDARGARHQFSVVIATAQRTLRVPCGSLEAAEQLTDDLGRLAERAWLPAWHVQAPAAAVVTAAAAIDARTGAAGERRESPASASLAIDARTGAAGERREPPASASLAIDVRTGAAGERRESPAALQGAAE